MASRQAGAELERDLSPKVCYEMKQMSQIGGGFGNHTTIDSGCVWPPYMVWKVARLRWTEGFDGYASRALVRVVRVVPVASDSANNCSSVCINCCMGVKGGAGTCMYHHPTVKPRGEQCKYTLHATKYDKMPLSATSAAYRGQDRGRMSSP